MKFKAFIQENGMYLAWTVALIATLGSLYFSEIRDFAPCKLCWYQRILMYPQVLLLGIAAVRKDYKQSLYIWPMALIGACISIYHILVQKTSWFEEAGTSCGLVPCTTQYIDWFGFVTIPMLALTAFLIIGVLQWLVWSVSKSDEKK